MPTLDPILRLLVAGGGLLLVLLLVRLLARRGSTRQFVRDIPLTGQHRVHVIEVEGRRMLIGTGPDGPPQLICELATSNHPDPTPNFGDSPWLAEQSREQSPTLPDVTAHGAQL